MANNTLIFLVIVSLFSQSFQDTNDNKIEIDPYKEAAKEVNKKYDAQTIGDTMKTLFENGGSDLLSSFVSEYGSQKDNSIFSGIKKMVGQKGGAPSILNTVGSLLNFIQAAKGGPRKGGEEDLTGTIIQGINEFKGFLDKNQESGGSIVNAAMAMLSQAGQQDGKSSGLTQILESLANVGDQGGQGQGAAALLSGMGSLLALTQQGRGEGEGGAALLEGLGALLGQGQTGENGQADALVQGLGALFGQGKNGENGKNEDLANLFGSVVNMLGQNEGSAKTADKKEAKSNDPKTDPDFNMNDLLTLAGSFMDQSGEKGGENNILSLLPSLLQTMNSFIGPEAESRAKSHEGHSSLMPPMLEKFHILFDHFLHSEAGQKVIEALGAEKSFKVFMDDKGRFSYKKFGEMMENLSYRKQWISIATDRIAEYVKHLSQPQVYKSYMLGAQIYLSTYLRGQGFPKATIFDPAKPVETISACINYIAKKYFDTKINSKEYVKPAVQYIKDTVKLAEKSGTLKSLGNSDELSNKLADTLNLEIIEPLVRVNRAYRFAKSTPKCERYVLCLVNEASQNDKENLPDLKKLLSKGSSLLAGWLLSANSGTPFWTLYTDITENTNCKKLYSTECDGFHAEELKVTTEYVHNEL